MNSIRTSAEVTITRFLRIGDAKHRYLNFLAIYGSTARYWNSDHVASIVGLSDSAALRKLQRKLLSDGVVTRKETPIKDSCGNTLYAYDLMPESDSLGETAYAKLNQVSALGSSNWGSPADRSDAGRDDMPSIVRETPWGQEWYDTWGETTYILCRILRRAKTAPVADPFWRGVESDDILVKVAMVCLYERYADSINKDGQAPYTGSWQAWLRERTKELSVFAAPNASKLKYDWGTLRVLAQATLEQLVGLTLNDLEEE